MRRLALLLAFAISASVFARSGVEAAPGYLKLRKQYGVVQSVGASALAQVAKTSVLELSGKPSGTCQIGDTTILVLGLPDGVTDQEVEAKNLPVWLADTTEQVRLLVRCDRKGNSLKVTLISAAREADVLPAEEAYWRALAEKRGLADDRGTASRPVASRGAFMRGRIAGGGTLYGRIGKPSGIHNLRLPTSQVTPIYAAFIRGQNPRLTPDQAYGIARDVIGFGIDYGIDPRLVIAILIVESGFDPKAVSHSGAIGLGQLMPETARWMGVHDSFDTTDNVYGMIKLLSTHSRQFGRDPSDPVVLAAYNAGEGAVRRHGGVPPYRETQAYVRRVTQYYQQLCSGG